MGDEEETGSIVHLTDVEVEFARGLVVRVRWARGRDDGFPSSEWSTKERLADALVLGNQDYLAAQGYRMSPALDRVCAGMVSRYGDRIAWLHKVGTLLNRRIRRLR
ncbi:hypothetical protein [Actinoallomurus iriomotensis]|uniref:Uncharacterized protein n=1 Tax=Actinoallomurus iriomotensis TaxID=478107 RepID=A0A9W6RB85_9ACTN|nr:hypothetical protein [Actinoallomurus iriomotensis]GLY72736.1 hypothetical protein Airi01_010030 [Actinoallomurus iriomotensis]